MELFCPGDANRQRGAAAREKVFCFLSGQNERLRGREQGNEKICENGEIGGRRGWGETGAERPYPAEEPGRNGRKSPIPSAGDGAGWKWAQYAPTQTGRGNNQSLLDSAAMRAATASRI